MFDCFGVRFVPLFSKKSQTFKMAKKARKKDKHGRNFFIFSQDTEQTWYHTSAFHLSAIGSTVHAWRRARIETGTAATPACYVLRSV